MFVSFDEEKFNKALVEKDYTRLKVNTVSAINNDPTFSGNEVEEVINKLKNCVPEIFEEEKVLAYEENLDERDWNKDYFSKLTFYFQNNFAESRISKIKKVGKKVYAGTELEKKFHNESNTSNKTNVKNPTQAPKSKMKQPFQSLAIPIAILAAVIALVLLLLKIFH